MENRKTGIANEFDFIKAINKRKLRDMDFNIQEMIIDIYDNKVCDDDLFYSWSDNNGLKTDIYIRKFNEDVKKRISIKMGSRNSVHVESLDSFINFLRDNGLSKEEIDFIRLYQYKDYTKDGSGIVRLTSSEFQSKYQIDIDLLNARLNNKELILNSINRFVINGRDSLDYIDVLIHGTVSDFVYIKRCDIYNLALLHINDYSKALHFSFLTYQTQNVNVSRNLKYERGRHYIQIKWYNLFDQIIENMNYVSIKSSKVV